MAQKKGNQKRFIKQLTIPKFDGIKFRYHCLTINKIPLYQKKQNPVVC